MRLKMQSRIEEDYFVKSAIDHKKMFARDFSREIAEKIMEYTEVTERQDEYSSEKILEAEIIFLPKSQYEHIMDMLRTLKGISPAIDSVIYQIRDEFNR